MLRLLICGLLLAALVFAGPPVAKITSSQPFQISGARVPVQGISSYPLVAGDKIVMGTAGGYLRFQDGTVAYVRASSRLDITGAGQATLVRLERGGLEYRFAGNSSVRFQAARHEATAGDSDSGYLWFQDDRAWWHPASAEFVQFVGVIRGAAGDDYTGSCRPVPANPNCPSQWQGYENPDFNNPGGEVGGGNPPQDPIDDNPSPISGGK